MGDDRATNLNNPLDTCTDVSTVARLFAHLNNPQNLLTYLVLTAWMKFMGVATLIPTITVGA